MKKLFVALLCLALLALCACETASISGEIQASENKPTSVIIWLTDPNEDEPTEPLTTVAPPVRIETGKSDPYAFVVKAYYNLEQNFAYYDTAVYHAVNDSKSNQKEKKLKKAFAQGFKMRQEDPFFVLWHGVLFEERKNFFYALYDLDNDGTKELLLGADGYLFDVYAIQNGIAVQQDSFGLFNFPAVLLQNGTLRVGGSTEIGFWNNYYRFRDGKLNFYALLELNDEEFNHHCTYADGKRFLITYEEYKRLTNEIEGDGQEVQLDWKPLADYGKGE